MKNEENILYGGDYTKKFEFHSFGHFIIDSLRNGGDCEALINGETDGKWTYSDILEETEKYARALFSFGIRKNDRIAIISENRHEIAAITFATFSINAITAPINFSYTKRELEHTLNVSKPKIIFVSKITARNVIDACKNLSFVEKIIHLDENNDFLLTTANDFKNKYELSNFFINYCIADQIDMREKTAMIFMSSGTTGLPKGCEITCENIMIMIEQYALAVLNYKEFGRRITTLNIAPWFHIMGFTNLFLILFSKRFRSIFLPKFDQNLFFMSIQKYRIETMTIPPPVVVLIAKSPLTDKFDVSSLKLLLCGAAPLARDVEEQVKKKFNNSIKLFTGYGLTEADILTKDNDFKTRTIGSVGTLFKAVYAKVIDENGNALGPNKVGELCFKGPIIMKGYYDNPKATAETIKDGWFHTGDLGYYNDEKQFFIVDRLKELIKYKAFQVPPAELEGLLLSHSKILDCGVIGIPDELAGELPFAFVVKKPGVELTDQEVKDFVAKNASNAKWLRGGVKFIDEIPKNPSGKILRRELRDIYKNTRAKL